MNDNYWEDCISKDGHTYIDDIADGRLKIYDVPKKYRTAHAYQYALRYSRSITNREQSFIEIKLIEKFLLDDIMKKSKKKKPSNNYIEPLRATYLYYFYDYGSGSYAYINFNENKKQNESDNKNTVEGV